MSYADASKRRKQLAEQQAVATSDTTQNIDGDSNENVDNSSDSSDSDSSSDSSDSGSSSDSSDSDNNS